MSSLLETRPLLWSTLLVFAIALALLAGFAALHEVTAPLVHDEYAYLLSADTFAHGRLTNPTHPLWRHFETFHVFQSPTYQAKYPPAQGLVLAAGQLLGDPVIGVWVSWAAAIAALFWMLACLVPHAWALFGSLLLLFHPYLFLVWGQTYWGGAVATAGGALFFGGVLRLRHRIALLDGCAIALGILLMGNSRPLEGLLTGLLALGLLLVYSTRRHERGEAEALLRRIWIPAALGVLVLVCWTLYYNARVTGDPFLLPYFNYHPELSPHEDIRAYTGSAERSLMGKGKRLVLSLLGLPLALALPFVWRRRRAPLVPVAALIVYIVGAVSVLSSRAWPHYLGTILCLLAFLSVASLRGLLHWRVRGRPLGLALFALVVVAHFGSWLVPVAGRVYNGPLASWAQDRIEMAASLRARGGKHLVLVRYGEGRDASREWIYNDADIDGSPVIWARDLGAEGNRELLEYFSDRTLWQVDVPPYRPRLRAYTSESVRLDDTVSR